MRSLLAAPAVMAGAAAALVDHHHQRVQSAADSALPLQAGGNTAQALDAADADVRDCTEPALA